MKTEKKLIQLLDYPLYIRYGDLKKNKITKSAANASKRHQTENGYQTYSVYKTILLIHVEDEENTL